MSVLLTSLMVVCQGDVFPVIQPLLHPQLLGHSRRCLVQCSLLSLATLLGSSACHYATFQPQPISASASAQDFDARTLENPDLQNFLRANFDPNFDAKKDNWSFESLCWVAFYYNPSLDSVRAAWKSAQANASGAHARPNPTLTLAPGFSANSPSGVPPWIPVVSVDLPIETAGKRAHRAAAADQEAESAHQAIFSAAWKLRSDLRNALLELVLAQTRLKNLRRQEEASLQVENSFAARLRAGTISAGEAAPARLAFARSQAARAEAEQQPGLARIKIASLLGVSASAVESLSVDSYSPAREWNEAEFKQLRDRALTTRPEILAALAHYNAAQAALALEIAKQYPDLHLGPAYQYDQGQSKWTLGFTAELPIFNHNQAGIAAASAHRVELAAQFTEIQAQVISEIDAAIANWKASRAQLANWEKLSAELSHQHTLRSQRLQAGAIDRLEEENAEVDFLTADAGRLEANVQVALASGQLEDALQVPLPRFDAIALLKIKTLP